MPWEKLGRAVGACVYDLLTRRTDAIALSCVGVDDGRRVTRFDGRAVGTHVGGADGAAVG